MQSELEEEIFNQNVYANSKNNDESEESSEKEESNKNETNLERKAKSENNSINENEEEDEEFEEDEESEDEETNSQINSNNYLQNLDNFPDISNSSSEENNIIEINTKKTLNTILEKEYDQHLLLNYKIKLGQSPKPKRFPRPNTNDLIFNSLKNDNIYLSRPNNYDIIPPVISFFYNIEDMNSSIKLIRPSQHKIPYNLKGFKYTINMFGFNIEPFCIDNNIVITDDKGYINDNNYVNEYVPVIKININNIYTKNVAKCKKCNAFYHKLSCYCKRIQKEKYYETYYYTCSICKNASKIYSIPEKENNNINNNNLKNLDINNIYCLPNINELPGICPSLEYEISNKNETFINRITLQIIVIEINSFALSIGFIDYVYQILYQIIKENNDNGNEYDKYFKYALIAYDSNKIYYYYLNIGLNHNSLHISIVNDHKDPFCPLPINEIIYDANNFLILLDKFYNWISLLKNKNVKNTNVNAININSIFKSINDTFNSENKNVIYYSHYIVFQTSYPRLNLNYLDEKNKKNKFYISLFLLMNKLDKNIPFINNNGILFIKLYYQSINIKDSLDIKQKFDKIFYDLNKILSNTFYKNYIYDLTINMCYDPTLYKNQLNKTNTPKNISFFPYSINLNLLYILPQIGYPELIQIFIFQFNVEYYRSLNNNKHIRILSWINHVSDQSKDIYDSYDVDCLFRVYMRYYINDFFNTNISIEKNFELKNNEKIENIVDFKIYAINKLFVDIKNKGSLYSNFLALKKESEKQIIETIFKYDLDVVFKTKSKHLRIPSKLNNFMLYFYCFFKTILTGNNLNIINSLYNDDITTFIKNLYPNLLSIKYNTLNKKETFFLKGLTVYYLNKKQLLLIDDGNVITIIINEKVDKDILNHFIINYNENMSEKTLNNFEFNCENMFLQNIVKNKAIKFMLINNKNVIKSEFLSLFVEDSILDDDKNNDSISNDMSYFDYYIKMNDEISNRFNKI